VADVGADDAVDGSVRERQHRQLAEQVVEARVGELREQALELVHGRLQDDDLVEAVEAVQRAAGGRGAEHAHDAAHAWWK
jgi:hypothetical protein